MQTLPSVFHHVDSTAALGALRRQGVGKIRHLSTRILWQQSLTKSQVLITLKVPTAVNVADLGTKGLSRSRTLMLKFMLSVYDAEAGAYVGESEYADHIQRDAARMAVRRIKQSGGSGVSKQMIRQIVIATLCIEHAAAACESDVLGPCHGTTRMSLMVFVVTAVAVACSLQGCYSREQFASLWITINVPQILLSAIFLLINRLLGIVLDTDAFTCLVQRVTSIAQPESEPTSPSGSMPSLETVSSEEEDIADAHDENGSEHSQEPAALRAFEPEPLDGDFEGVETEPAMLAGDIEDIVIPDDQMELQVVVHLPAFLRLEGGMVWYVAPISGRRIHVYRNCGGLRNARMVLQITEQQRLNSRFRNFEVCSLCRLRIEHTVRHFQPIDDEA